MLIPLDGYARVVRHFDGRSTLMEIQARVLQETGHFVAMKELEDLVRRFDEAMIIDGPAFAMFHQQYRQARRRPAALAGRSYAATLRALRAQLEHLFVGQNGAGAPAVDGDGRRRASAASSARTSISSAAGPVYTWSYRELVERSRRRHVRDPGRRSPVLPSPVRADLQGLRDAARRRPRPTASYVDGLAAIAGRDLFDDELTHRTEHSIEFQVVFLQYLLGGRRDFTIVPILVGSFHDLMERGIDPIQDPEVRRFIDALRAVEAGHGKKVAYIGGIDLCHVGPEFGDPSPVDPILQEQVRRFDGEMLDRAAAGDAEGWFRTAGASAIAGGSAAWRRRIRSCTPSARRRAGC